MGSRTTSRIRPPSTTAASTRWKSLWTAWWCVRVSAAESRARHVGFSLDTPFEALEPGQQQAILQGTGDAWIGLTEGKGQREKGKGKRGKGKPESADSALSPFPFALCPRFQYKGLFPAI